MCVVLCVVVFFPVFPFGVRASNSRLGTRNSACRFVAPFLPSPQPFPTPYHHRSHSAPQARWLISFLSPRGLFFAYIHVEFPYLTGPLPSVFSFDVLQLLSDCLVRPFLPWSLLSLSVVPLHPPPPLRGWSSPVSNSLPWTPSDFFSSCLFRSHKVFT